MTGKVAALLDQVAPAGTWRDIGGSFNPHRPARRRCTARPACASAMRRRAAVGGIAPSCASDSSGQGSGVAQPVPILGRDPRQGRGRWAELEEFVPHVQPSPSQESYLRLFEELGRLHAGLRAAWEPDLPSRSTTTEPTASCTTGSASRVAVWALGPSRLVRRAKLLLDELGKARRGYRAPACSNPRRLQARQRGPACPTAPGRTLDLDFSKIRERLYDVAASLVLGIRQQRQRGVPLPNQ